MSNVYCDVPTFCALYDVRTMAQLSNDDDVPEATVATIQTILDMEASELDSYLTGRYGLPLVSPPGVLSKWVAAKTAGRLFARRNDKPKQVEADEAWAAEFLKNLMDGRIGLAGIDRACQPTLSSSDSTDGTSRFDWLYGFGPSETGVSKGK